MWLLNLPQIYIIKKNQFCLKDGKKYEKGHTSLTGNYRPVSLTSTEAMENLISTFIVDDVPRRISSVSMCI